MKRLLYSMKKRERESNGERTVREKDLLKKTLKTILYLCRSKGGTQKCVCKNTIQHILISALAQRHWTVSKNKKKPTSPVTIKTEIPESSTVPIKDFGMITEDWWKRNIMACRFPSINT